MAAEALEHLAIRPDGIYIDATAGLGGHTAQIAARLTTGLVIANDRDELSLAMARQNTLGVERTHPVPSWTVQRTRASHGRSGSGEGARAAGRSWSQPVSAHGAGARFFVLVRWAVGYADGSNHRHNGGRVGQSHAREGACRSDLSAWRRKEGAENSQSNRPNAAHTEHATSGRCSGAGRAPDGSCASGHANFHGPAHQIEPRTGRVRPAARNRIGFALSGRTDGGHQFHVERRPKSERAI